MDLACVLCAGLTAERSQRQMSDDDEDIWNEFDPDAQLCHYCGGDGYGIVGCDWDSDDYINGPYDGEVQRCPCCHGSGKAEDCTFW